jgi:monoamine oxidase
MTSVPSESTTLGGDPIGLAAPVSSDLARVPAQGLAGRRTTRKKRVIIIGAGIAGLVAAFELSRCGHEPVILEAQNRVGGRVYTLRNFAPNLYAEAGPMRIPRVHELTIAYCELFGLQLRPFVMDNPRTLVYIAGKRHTMAAVNQEPELLGFDLDENERGRTYQQLWDDATRELRELYDRDGDAALDAMASQYGHHSIRDFLIKRGFSQGALELYGVMSFREANMNAAVIEQLRELLGRAFLDMQEIVGGMDLLPRAFYQHLRTSVRFGAQVYAITQDSDKVTAHYRSRAGNFSESGDYAICTIPFGVLRHLDFVPPLSRRKYRAIRELHYNASTKILLQVAHRFWEKADGIVGGTTATDLPIRRLVYPSHSDPQDERGILLASYTWGQDAIRWGALSDEDRISLALKDVAKIHPQILDEVEGGASHAWHNDPWAGGAFALFEPGQQQLHDDTLRHEGRISFAGEHCSLWHAWIQGALESGIRAAEEVHAAPGV